METGSALALTIASVVGLLPQAIIGPFAGVWIDRFNRKKIMIFIEDMKQGILTIKSNKAMIVLSMGLFGLCSFISGFLPATWFWVFCIAVFIMGTTSMGFNIPFTAYIQRTVPSENMGKVISLVTSIMSFAAPVGMFIAGPVSELLGVSNWMILAGVLMVFFSLLCYLLTREFDIPLNKESSVSGENKKNHHATGDHLKNHIVLPGLRLIPF